MTWVLIALLLCAVAWRSFRGLQAIAHEAYQKVEENEAAALQFLAAMKRADLDEQARRLGIQRVLVAAETFERQHYPYLVSLVPAFAVECRSLKTARDLKRVTANLDAALMFVANEAPILEAADFFTLVRGIPSLEQVVSAGQERIEQVHAFLLEV